MNRMFGYFFLCVILISAAGCTSGISSEMALGKPEDHYKTGLQKLNSNHQAGAEEEFNRAVALGKKTPYGHTGFALLELSRTNYKRALKHAERALKYDSSFSDAHLATGRILTAWKRRSDWADKALESFEKALELAPENENVLYYTAEYYYEAGEYERAIEYYTRANVLSGDLAETAAKKIEHTKKMIEASPLSDEGKRIADIEKISRADLCILLIEEFKLKQLLHRHRPEKFNQLFNADYSRIARTGRLHPEIGNNPAKEWILDIIQIDIPFLDPYPDGYFYPDRLVTKSQFAVTVQEVLAMVNDDRTLTTRYIGMESGFDDVRTDYYAFNAVNLCVDLGIMTPEAERIFDPNGSVSGIDAILMLRKAGEYVTEH